MISANQRPHGVIIAGTVAPGFVFPESFNHYPKLIREIWRVDCHPRFRAVITPLRGKGRKIELQGSRAFGGMALRDVTPAPVVEPPPPAPARPVLREADYQGHSYVGRVGEPTSVEKQAAALALSYVAPKFVQPGASLLPEDRDHTWVKAEKAAFREGEAAYARDYHERGDNPGDWSVNLPKPAPPVEQDASKNLPINPDAVSPAPQGPIGEDVRNLGISPSKRRKA